MHPDMRTRVQVALQILNFIHSTQSKQPRRSTLHNAGIIPSTAKRAEPWGAVGCTPSQLMLQGWYKSSPLVRLTGESSGLQASYQGQFL